MVRSIIRFAWPLLLLLVSLPMVAQAQITPIQDYAELRTREGTPGSTVAIQYAQTIGDGLGGLFYWDAAATAADDNATLIQPNGVATGRWRRILNTPALNTELSWLNSWPVLDEYGLFSGLLAQTGLMQAATTTLTPTSTNLYLIKLIAPKTGTCSKIGLRVTTAGATLTAGAANNGVAVYNGAGVRLALADGVTPFTTVGDKSLVVTPFALTKGSVYWVAVCTSGTTPARFQSLTAQPLRNYSQTAAPWNFQRSTVAGGLPATLNLTASQNDARTLALPWVGLFQ
jgi:hypothetical protein